MFAFEYFSGRMRCNSWLSTMNAPEIKHMLRAVVTSMHGYFAVAERDNASLHILDSLLLRKVYVFAPSCLLVLVCRLV